MQSYFQIKVPQIINSEESIARDAFLNLREEKLLEVGK